MGGKTQKHKKRKKPKKYKERKQKSKNKRGPPSNYFYMKNPRINKTIKKINNKKQFNLFQKQFSKKMCSAGRKNYTCYSRNALDYLKQKWNKSHPKKLIHTNDPKEIWLKLRKYMKNNCVDEKCWLEQNFIKDQLTQELQKYTFSPKAPKIWEKNKNQWLTSTDILKVMEQFEYEYNNFKFIGPSPIDFDVKKQYNQCVWDELCKFNLNKLLKNNKTMMGFVFNLDPHYKRGSHWVSMFINMDQKFLFYNDSTGYNPPKQIKILINRILSQAKNMSIHLEYIINKIKHQKKDTECGIYSLYFISELLKGRHPTSFSQILDDNYIEQYRKIYFNV